MKTKNEYLRELTLVGLLFLLLLSALAGCKKDDDNAPAPSPSQPANEVWMQNTAFVPNSITVSVNTTVVWKNKDSMTHNVVANDGSFNSGNIGGGGNTVINILPQELTPIAARFIPV